jgi:hypothetical protein
VVVIVVVFPPGGMCRGGGVGPPVVPSNAVYFGLGTLDLRRQSNDEHASMPVASIIHTLALSSAQLWIYVINYRVDIAWPRRVLHSFYNAFANQLLFDLPCLVDAMDDNENVCMNPSWSWSILM